MPEYLIIEENHYRVEADTMQQALDIHLGRIPGEKSDDLGCYERHIGEGHSADYECNECGSVTGDCEECPAENCDARQQAYIPHATTCQCEGCQSEQDCRCEHCQATCPEGICPHYDTKGVAHAD